jgi:glycosyltransferase involved in cell wall biosynthesis
MKLSVVIPVYNGAATLPKVVADCYVALAHLDFELVLVNDGSKDNSEELIFNLAKEHPNIKAISLTKNFGEFNAVMCGLNFAVGDYVAIIDDDGQNPPAEILKLLAEAEKGFKVVYARYEEKKHSWWRNAGSWLNNLLATVFIGKPWGLYLSSFKVMRKALVAEVVKYEYGKPYIDSIIFRETNKVSTVSVNHVTAGESRYSVAKLLQVFYSMFICAKYKYIAWVYLVFAFMGVNFITGFFNLHFFCFPFGTGGFMAFFLIISTLLGVVAKLEHTALNTKAYIVAKTSF